MMTSDRRSPTRRRGLDPAGVEAAAANRGVLGDIHRCAAVFAAERESLEHAQGDQDDRGRPTDSFI